MATFHFAQLARYHRWAFDQIFASLQKIPVTEYMAERGLAFGSIHATLNHLLLADELWYMRISGLKRIGERSLENSSQFWVKDDNEAWATLTKDMDDVTTQIHAQCDRWDTLVGALTESVFTDVFTYHDTQGHEYSGLLGSTLDHVFNHGTHYRGQISAAITQLGEPAICLDLMWYVNNVAVADASGGSK